MTFKILELFGVASIQGQCVPGMRQFGVPVRGPFDPLSHGLANALVGNLENAPCLELSLAAAKIEILSSGSLSWVGAGAWQGVKTFKKGEIVDLLYPQSGARSYLGGKNGFRLASPGIFQADSGSFKERTLAEEPFSHNPIRVYRGAHSDLCDFDKFIHLSYTVSGDSNRMGVRLISETPQAHQIELTSEPTDVGIIQMPSSGNPIVLGPDGPTIGGYPQIACVIECDMAKVGQLAPGERIAFEEVSRDRGEEICRQSKRAQDRLLALIRSQVTG